MIHGQKNGYGRLSFLVQRFNWTNGCIALSDRDMEQVWMAVDPGTPIEIRP
jgi:murein L,D-transpeptidase YafK